LRADHFAVLEEGLDQDVEDALGGRRITLPRAMGLLEEVVRGIGGLRV
jgi:hypothetical protein